MAKKRRSILFTLAIITIATVGVIMGLQTLYSYHTIRESAHQELIDGVHLSLRSLERNIAAPMSAYAVNEYQNIVDNELKLNQGRAIIVDDLKMGEITGQSAYRSGRIRDAAWHIVEFDANNADHLALLEQSFYSHRSSVSGQGGEVLGWITLYASDLELQQRLDGLLLDKLIGSLGISILLIVALFVGLRIHLLQPISRIADTIRQTDTDGIPSQPAPADGPREIALLAKTVNRMIKTIDHSRKELRAEHSALERERERFQLAVEGSQDGVWDWDIRTSYLYHSARFETMLGYEPGELPDNIKAWQDLLHPEDAEAANEQVKRYLDTLGEGVYESTFRMRTKDGDWRWITGRGKAVFAEDGTPLRFIGFNSDVTRLVVQQQELQDQKVLLQYQANHDSLTGLANRSLFGERLEQAIARAKRSHVKLALLFIDLDHFKEINDSLGHRTGDKVLNSVTQRLQQSVRTEDVLARLGGDEFAILMEGINQEQDASIRAETILKTIAQPFSVEGHQLFIGSSIGISIFPDNGITARDLLKNADAAMYKAKNEGRNNFQYYSAEMTTLAFERLHLETALRSAVTDQEFIVYYQPQIDIAQGRIIGIEALVRWQHPTLGLVPPNKFIPIAESSGLIVDIDRLVMRMAMQQLVEWHNQGVDHGILALNLSVKHVHRKDFITAVVATLIETGCNPAWIEFEVTETQVMDDPDEAINMLHRLENLGIKLALDDFGTGHSSLAYLKRMPITKLKIDQSFVRDLPEDAEDAAISKAVIALGKSLDLELLAEGMERQEQIDFMLEHGCDKVQGYFYSQPLPAQAMKEFFANWQGGNVRKLFA